jgi:hypothetical protein
MEENGVLHLPPRAARQGTALMAARGQEGPFLCSGLLDLGERLQGLDTESPRVQARPLRASIGGASCQPD